jgi:cytochrome c6
MLSIIMKKQGVCVVALLFLFLFAIPHSAAAQAPNLEKGQILFEQICAKCHGADGSKTTSVGKAVRAKDLRSPAVQKRTDTELYTQISDGTTNMPPFRGNYKKAEINDLLSYLRELGNVQAIAAQTPDPETGQILFEQICAKCHGADGSKTTSVGKAVKAEDLRGTAVQQLTDAEIYRQIAGGTKNMPPFEGTYRKAQINDLIAYVRKLGKAHADSKKSI